MTSKLTKLLQKYYEKLTVLRAFESAQSILSWDRETYIPKGAAVDRGETMSVLAGFTHELFTDKKFVQVVDGLLEHRDELSPLEKRSLHLVKRDLDKSTKLPKEFVEETQTVMNAGHTAWLEAKAKDDFEIFRPLLAKVVENRRQYAEYLQPNKNPYDVNLDDYEEGLTSAKLEPLFSQLKYGIGEILPEILQLQLKKAAVKNPLDTFQADPHALQKFIHEMLEQIGFDWSRGAMGSVEHPFEISISANDIRLNTHYETTHHSYTLTGMIHELGHGLYEQNIDPQYVKPGLGHGVTLGIHESQSRLLENMIGRSTSFWKYFFPKLQNHFPQLKSAQVEDVVTALNRVSQSLIRTEADEVTYNLHIILRFELEKELIHGRLAVKDLPEVWRAKMKELLGVEPKTNREGVLQDVHWSWGNFGYFPTYTLGNLNAAQLWHTFVETHPKWSESIENGDFHPYFKWFKEHVWQYGAFYEPDVLIQKATAKTTSADYLLRYLKEKYLP